ncbi:MAG: radical SAM protein [Bacteroidetes bacterium]|nr:radical SAM protein [Bacteroidota bacterium]
MDFTSFLDPLEELRDCAICPRNCHSDRFSGKGGYCKSDASFNISSICIHRGEEPAISGSKGICNIFFTHCNLQCIYCQNYQISDNHIPAGSTEIELDEVLRQITKILDTGINRVGFVSPSHFIPQVRIIINCLREIGYSPTFVYNTNSYDRAEIIRSLEGSIDVYLPDIKYMDNDLARDLSDAPGYPEIASGALKEMYRQKGSVLHTDENGMAVSGIIIRHLVLPGQVQNSIGVLNFIAGELSPNLHISLMSQYYPTPAVSCHPFLKRTVSASEYAMVTGEMERLGLSNGWIQELSSHHHYRPDFEQEHPFE